MAEKIDTERTPLPVCPHCGRDFLVPLANQANGAFCLDCGGLYRVEIHGDTVTLTMEKAK
jgi:hypothetical protein